MGALLDFIQKGCYLWVIRKTTPCEVFADMCGYTDLQRDRWHLDMWRARLGESTHRRAAYRIHSEYVVH